MIRAQRGARTCSFFKGSHASAESGEDEPLFSPGMMPVLPTSSHRQDTTPLVGWEQSRRPFHQVTVDADHKARGRFYQRTCISFSGFPCLLTLAYSQLRYVGNPGGCWSRKNGSHHGTGL
ncbi:hypothetical protein GE21DRAFT_7042 [Neurospora crassa]|uniref:Uncharacterized protein n=1 Tax=Neurospora crassa (strain ATCC 24698 / 74-OR23-1A / CBS 708.71 / DSM 1257 / FGSC 987) TaxID=367110 RepID=Q7S3B6_NEUCR|nr:hypothetical protein NCU04658 [Neurospora crassa OR74A]EAA29965.1 hypothetical protein NCU04658 [Neurospora crassa OR74A]KHE83414.1 hypothetical protein GE21DRAFT_7042 [Neurospora crassa]|eukprot:XP_959201.1 hypothetical protein NCU04658 [Neurospora crassa OR74A]